MDDGLLPPIVESEVVCPLCCTRYVTSYRQGNIRVSSGQRCPRCEAAAGERRQARHAPKKASPRHDRTYDAA
jgi:hypothetical protein